MSDEVFEHLADALQELPNGFPRTPSNVEIRMLKKMFSIEEATLARHLTYEYENAESIAERTGSSEKAVHDDLVRLAKRGFVRYKKQDGKLLFRLAPFMVGSYEAFIDEMDHEFAHLFETYMEEGGAAGIMEWQPALHRVVPAQDTVKSEYILPYDDIKAMFQAAVDFRVRDCICRKQQDLISQRKCDFPLKMCMDFSSVERPKRSNTISKEEALALLERTEELGLVHTVSNTIKDVYYVCNCCGCCCGILRGITDWGIARSVAYANYYADVDAEECTGCGVCLERCQVHAITEQDSIALIDRERCIGCGLCVTGCSVRAISLMKRPDAEVKHPPADFSAWEKERLKNRELE